ncbi:MAG TPA: polyprenol phosphomannose-dependent alpha 1,6 mannosyltransferase MptB [Rugosimonospora sp.]|nr:polyprenol phosphomannose-dependent alpha 1,6 mannosyltransferase MptB [Rugosimonospora sp.]
MIAGVGFAGAVLLAVAAYLGGAGYAGPFHPAPVSIWRQPHGPATLLCWLFGVAAMAGAWWAGRRVPAGRRVYATAALWLLPFLAAPPLGSRDVYAYACQGAVYHAGHNPYAEGVAALPCPWVGSVSTIWRDTPAPYGPLFLMIAGAAVAIGGTLAATIAVLRAVALLGVLLAAVSLPALARHANVAPERAGWLALACPLVGIHLIGGAHNDALMLGLLLAGLAVITLRPTGAGPAERAAVLLAGGVLLGLAASVKASAAVAVPFAALLALRGGYSPRALLRDGGWVVGGAVATLLAVTGVSGLGFGWLRGLSSSGASVQWTAPSTAIGMTIDLFHPGFDAVPATRAVGLALLVVVLALLWWRTRTRDALHATGLALAATVALAPVFHPWYATWPLFVLAVCARRTAWFAVPCLVACFLDLPDGTSLALSTRAQGAVAMTLLVGYLLVRAARRRRRTAPTG